MVLLPFLKKEGKTLKFSRLTCVLATALFLGGGVCSSRANGIFVSGHDSDFHAVQQIGDPDPNTAGAQHIIQKAILYVTNNKTNPHLLLVTDRINPGGGPDATQDPVNGLHAAGYTNFDVADDGSSQSALDLHTVVFTNYDAVIVASDYGGWLRQSELDILNARAAAIADYINNHNGGLVAFAESGGRSVIPNTYPGTTHDRFGFVPTLVSTIGITQPEANYTLTPFGTSLGLLPSDINGNFSHNIFTAYAGLNVVDTDAIGQVVTLAGKTVPTVGPPPMFSGCGTTLSMLWPPNHDLVNVGYNYTLVPTTGPAPTVTVHVYSNEPDMAAEGGDDHFSPDARNISAQLPQMLRLRAERTGAGDGRVYLIVVSATNAGGTSYCATSVVVPHDQSKKSIASIEAQAAAAEDIAESTGHPPTGYVEVGTGPVVGPKQ